MSIGFLRSSCQGRIRYARKLLGEMPAKEDGLGLGGLGGATRPICRSDPCERRKEGKLDEGNLLDCTAVLRKFGSADRESLSQSC